MPITPEEAIKRFAPKERPVEEPAETEAPTATVSPADAIARFSKNVQAPTMSAPEVAAPEVVAPGEQPKFSVDPAEAIKRFKPAVRQTEDAAAAPTNDNKYLKPEMMANPQLMTALERHYAAKGETFDTPEEMFDEYVSDMRYIDGNLMYAGAYLTDVLGAKDRGDVDYLKDIKVLRDEWAKKSSVFKEEGEWDVIKGVGANIAAGILDPTSLLYLIPGGLQGKLALSKGAQFAATLGLDAAINAGLNAGTQAADIEADVRTDFSGTEVAGAAALGMAPGIALKGAQKGWNVGQALYKEYFPTNGMSGRQPVDQAFMKRIKSAQGAEDESIKPFQIQNSETGTKPFMLRSKDDIQVAHTDPVTGQPMVFDSASAAGQYAYNSVLAGAALTPKQLTTVTRNPAKFFSDKKNPTGWFIAEERFNDLDEAKAFVRKNGAVLGTNDWNKYTAFDKGVTAPTTGWNNLTANADMVIQRYFNDNLSLDRLVSRGKALVRANANADPSINSASLLLDTPADLRAQAQNSNVTAAAMINLKPVALVDMPNMPGAKQYVLLENEKSLADIYNGMHTQFVANGVDDYNTMLREFGAYALGKRIIEKERPTRPHPTKPGQLADPLNMGMKMDEVDAFMQGIQADPMRLRMYEQGIQELQQFNKLYLDFQVAHGTMSAEMAAKLMAEGDYMPLVRLHDASEMFYSINKGRAAATFRKGISDKEKVRGQELLDPLEAYARHVGAGIRSAQENRVWMQTIDWMRAAGQPFMDSYLAKAETGIEKRVMSIANIKATLQRVLGPAAVNINVTPQTAPNVAIWIRRALLSKPEDKNTMFVLRDGKPEFYTIKDPLLADTIHAAGFDAANTVMRAANEMDGFNKVIQGSVWFNNAWAKLWTLNPIWNTFKALPADAVTSWMLKPTVSANLKTNFLDLPFINAANGLTKKLDGKNHVEFLINGGGMSGLHAQVGNYKNAMAQAAAKMGLDPEKMVGLSTDQDVKLWRRLSNAAFQNSGLETWANKVESAPRITQYENNLADGMSASQAARQAAESTVDFRMRGTSRDAMVYQRAMAAFTRPLFNGVYQTFSRYLPTPGNYRFTGKDRAVLWSKLVGLTVLPTLAYEVLQDQDPYYEALTDDKKDRFFFIPLNMHDGKDGYITIPKYPEQGFGSNLTRYYFQELRKTEEGRSMWKLMVSHVWHGLAVAGRFDDFSGNLPVPVAAAFNLNSGQIGGHPSVPEAQQGLSGENQGDIRNVGNMRSLNDEELKQHLGVINRAMGTNFAPSDIPILTQTVLSGMSQYVLNAYEFMYLNKKGTYEFDPRQTMMFRGLYDPARPVRFTSYEQRLNEYEERIMRITNDIQAAKGQAKIFGLDEAMKKLRGEDAVKYKNYLVAGELLQKVQKVRQEHMKNIQIQYNLKQQKTPTRQFDDEIDKLFEAKNKVIIPLVKDIGKILAPKPRLEDATNRALTENAAEYEQADSRNPVMNTTIAKYKRPVYEKDEAFPDSSGASLPAMIGNIATTSPKDGYKELAAAILDKVPDLQVGIKNSEHGFNKYGKTVSEPEKGVTKLKLFDATKDWKASGVNEETVLHEALHAALHTAIHQKENFEDNQFYKELGELRHQVNVGAWPKDKNGETPMWFTEGVDSTSEFLSYALTNPQFQAELKTRKGYKKGTSAWTMLKESVKDWLGMDTDSSVHTDALEAAMDISGNLINEMPSQTKGIMNAKRK